MTRRHLNASPRFFVHRIRIAHAMLSLATLLMVSIALVACAGEGGYADDAAASFPRVPPVTADGLTLSVLSVARESGSVFVVVEAGLAPGAEAADLSPRNFRMRTDVGVEVSALGWLPDAHPNCSRALRVARGARHTCGLGFTPPPGSGAPAAVFFQPDERSVRFDIAASAPARSIANSGADIECRSGSRAVESGTEEETEGGTEQCS